MKIGIIGLGHLHPRSYMPHFQAIPGVEVAAVVEANTGLREAFCRDFKLPGFATVDELLKTVKLDVAAIFLPHVDCPAAAAQCAARGIHLMVEKPMASSAAGAAAIVQSARQAGVKLTTGYAWRLHPVASEFRKIIQSGTIGEIVGAEGRCAAGKLNRYIEGHSPWILQKALSGGGPMYNLGVHWIDLFRWFLEDEVAEVSGRNVKVNTQYDVEDNSFAHLKFSKGAVVALDISYTVPDSFPHGRDLYLSARGTRGVISWAPAFEGQRDTLFICRDKAESREYDLPPTPGYAGGMGREYVRSFIDAVANNRPLPVTGEDGVAALQVVEAIYKADKEKRWVGVDKL
ncbi:MAG: Gfo/Idh/MocA family oxidoreductase [Verrucomicrobiota bacterium]